MLNFLRFCVNLLWISDKAIFIFIKLLLNFLSMACSLEASNHYYLFQKILQIITQPIVYNRELNTGIVTAKIILLK